MEGNMYRINDYLIYKNEVVVVNDILYSYKNNTDYYSLSILSDDSLRVKVPVDSLNIRTIISKKELDDLIKKIPDIKIIDVDSKLLEYEYKKLLHTNKCEDLVKIIKTTYLRNKDRLDNNKKTTDKDMYYFNLSERLMYQEVGVVLGISIDEAREYIVSKILAK